MKNESVKKSLGKSRNVLEESAKWSSEKFASKKIAGRTPEANWSAITSQKTVIAAEAITFCIKPFTHYLPRSDLKISENLNHCRQEKNAAKNYIIENVWYR